MTGGAGDTRVTVLYDAECPFCSWTVGMLVLWDRQGRIEPVELQDESAQRLLPQLSEEERMATAHALAGGERRSGGDAFVPIFAALPAGRPLSWLAARLPRPTRRLYELTSEHRDKLIRLVPDRLQRHAADRLSRRVPG